MGRKSRRDVWIRWYFTHHHSLHDLGSHPQVKRSPRLAKSAMKWLVRLEHQVSARERGCIVDTGKAGGRKGGQASCSPESHSLCPNGKDNELNKIFLSRLEAARWGGWRNLTLNLSSQGQSLTCPVLFSSMILHFQTPLSSHGVSSKCHFW